jgi:hypothetical protein
VPAAEPLRRSLAARPAEEARCSPAVPSRAFATAVERVPPPPDPYFPEYLTGGGEDGYGEKEVIEFSARSA